jgi:hypothetical protein
MPEVTSVFSGSKHTFAGILTFDELYAEVGRLKAALTAGGILGADRIDLTNLSVQSKMVRFRLLAESLGIADFDFLDMDDGSRDVPVKFSFTNPMTMAVFRLALTNAASKGLHTASEDKSHKVRAMCSNHSLSL